ncbi:MAG: hypothetical protein Q8M15_13810 [Bacteroidota bacterium]|nr:hypothetical protein [Bacteroidota bacterium]
MLLRFLFPAQFSTFNTNWKEALSQNSFIIQLFSTLGILGLIGVFIPIFFSYIQSVQGYQINDLILNEIPVRNMSVIIFLLIYSVIIIGIINLISNPLLFMKCLQAYCLLVLIRIVCLYLVPLEPERSIIPLEDPFLAQFFYSGKAITKDLFFSGHVSTMALLTLAIPFVPLKYIFAVATLIVAVLIMVQHVHYSIDVIAAPFFSWISFRLIGLLTGK